MGTKEGASNHTLEVSLRYFRGCDNSGCVKNVASEGRKTAEANKKAYCLQPCTLFITDHPPQALGISGTRHVDMCMTDGCYEVRHWLEHNPPDQIVALFVRPTIQRHPICFEDIGKMTGQY